MTGDLSSSPLQPLDAVNGAAGTDVGKKRQNNEDSHLVVEAEGFKSFLIADGMGGARGGKTASSVAVNTMEEYLRAHSSIDIDTITRAYAEANKAIFDKGLADAELEGMGTTLVSLTFSGTALYIGNVGDSRAYRIRNNRIAQLTEDHTLVMELLRSGAINPSQVKNHPVSHMLTRSLGPTPQVEVDCRLCEDGPARGDIYIICSDGLHNGVTPDEMLEIAKSRNTTQMVTELIELANKKGGSDNITTIVIEIGPDFPVGPDEFEGDRDEDLHLDLGGSFGEESPLSANGYVSTEPPAQPSRFFPFVGAATLLGFVAGGLLALVFYTPAVSPPDQRSAISVEQREPEAVPTIEERSAVAMLLEAPVEQPTAAPASPDGPISNEGLSRQRSRIDLEAQLESAERRLSWISEPAKVDEHSARLAAEIEDLKRSIQENSTRAESAFKRLAYWKEREGEIASNDASAVVSEVAVLSEEVKDKKDAFERATWEYLEEVEALKYAPGDAAQEAKVESLAERRKGLLEDLNQSVLRSIRDIRSKIEAEIGDINVARDAATARLKVMYSDLELVKLLEQSDDSALKRLESEVSLQRDTIETELEESAVGE